MIDSDISEQEVVKTLREAYRTADILNRQLEEKNVELSKLRKVVEIAKELEDEFSEERCKCSLEKFLEMPAQYFRIQYKLGKALEALKNAK